jgi:hypothetical protein
VLQKQAEDREALVQARCALKMRMRILETRMNNLVKRGRNASAEELGPIQELAAGILTGVTAESEDLARRRDAADPAKKAFLGRLAEEYGRTLKAILDAEQSMPILEPELSILRKGLTGPNSGILGDDGSFTPVIDRLKGLLGSSERWHSSQTALARSLLATALALEGFRTGKPKEQIRTDCRPYVDKNYEQILKGPGKVLDLLESLK